MARFDHDDPHVEPYRDRTGRSVLHDVWRAICIVWARDGRRSFRSNEERRKLSPVARSVTIPRTHGFFLSQVFLFRNRGSRSVSLRSLATGAGPSQWKLL